MAYKPQYTLGHQKHGHSDAANTAVKGIVDVTKIAVVGQVGIGMIGAAGAAFKK